VRNTPLPKWYQVDKEGARFVRWTCPIIIVVSAFMVWHFFSQRDLTMYAAFTVNTLFYLVLLIYTQIFARRE
jgi:uncharacterized membrane protein YjjP (DUF1212 family)